MEISATVSWTLLLFESKSVWILYEKLSGLIINMKIKMLWSVLVPFGIVTR